jgi:hypothetical protein
MAIVRQSLTPWQIQAGFTEEDDPLSLPHAVAIQIIPTTPSFQLLGHLDRSPPALHARAQELGASGPERYLRTRPEGDDVMVFSLITANVEMRVVLNRKAIATTLPHLDKWAHGRPFGHREVHSEQEELQARDGRPRTHDRSGIRRPALAPFLHLNTSFMLKKPVWYINVMQTHCILLEIRNGNERYTWKVSEDMHLEIDV